MRLFFAIPLPQALKDDLKRFQTRSQALGVAASWPDPVGLHLTLAFLGETDASGLPQLSAIAQAVGSRQTPFPLATAILGGFPRNPTARVLWVGLDDQPKLADLAAKLRQGLKSASMAFDEKPFKPHLTLARFRTPTDISRFLPPPVPVAFKAQELVLYQSHLTPSGSRYEPILTVALEGDEL